MPIKNIIFDLGGVILNIDYNQTYAAFNKLGIENFNSIFTKHRQDGLFDHFETGKITASNFREQLRKNLSVHITDEEMDRAWNAMLLDLPINRLDYIKSLREKYKIFLFSNINEIHMNEFFNICQKEHSLNTFDDYFEKAYYSHIFGKRKPNLDAFSAILAENNMIANETLFIDDTLQHIVGAKEVGLHTIHLTKDKSIFDIDKYLLTN